MFRHVYWSRRSKGPLGSRAINVCTDPYHNHGNDVNLRMRKFYMLSRSDSLTFAMELRLLKDKLDRINREIVSWKEKCSCTKRELQSLTGQLQHAATVVRPGRTFIRRLYDMIAATRSAHHHVPLNIEARSDIAWWSTFLLSWNGVSMLTPGLRQLPQHVVTSDASGHWGCGTYYCRAEWFQLSWQGTPLANASIAVKELVPLVVAAALWGRQWSGSTVMCKCDNQAVVAVIGSRTSSDKQIMHMLRCLFFLEASFDYHLVASHIPGIDNVLADDLSRNRPASFLQKAHPATAKSPCQIPQHVKDLLFLPHDWTSEVWRSQFLSILMQA